MNLEPKQFEKDLMDLDSLEKIQEYFVSKGLTDCLSHLYKKGGILIDTIEKELREILNAHNFKILKRVKSPKSIFFKLLLNSFDSKALYDLIGFRLLNNGIESTREIRSLLNKCYAVPENLSYLWNPSVWPLPPGGRDWLESPNENGYRSLDYHFLSPDGSLFEIQSRPEEFEKENDKNYLVYKRKQVEKLKVLVSEPESREQLVGHFSRFFQNAERVNKNGCPDHLFDLCLAYDIHNQKAMWKDEKNNLR